MLGIDEKITGLAGGGSVWILFAVAVLLGLRHATDPDHLAAVAVLAASDRVNCARSARRLGLTWGCGHAVSLLALGITA